MKLPDLKEFIHIWPKSLGILKERVINFFLVNNISIDNVWFPDIDIIFPEALLDKNNIQVIFFGGFIERVFETGNWPERNYTFWCLSSRLKNFLVNIISFPEDSVRVIPRGAMFEKHLSIRQLDFAEDIQIVYSGRLSSQKNIEMIIAFSNALSKRVQSKIEVYFLGEWDNHIPKNRGRFVIDSYRNQVEKFCEKLGTSCPLFFITDLNETDWLKVIKRNCLMVNFSTFACEDFGVSIAQGQEIGLPMLLSDWGGHSDVSGENITFVDVDDIAESFSLDEKIILKGEALADKFFRGDLKKEMSVIHSSLENEHFLSLAQLHHIRHSLLCKYGHELALLGQDRMSLVASSQPGKIFFKDHFRVFAGKE